MRCSAVSFFAELTKTVKFTGKLSCATIFAALSRLAVIKTDITKNTTIAMVVKIHVRQPLPKNFSNLS